MQYSKVFHKLYSLATQFQPALIKKLIQNLQSLQTIMAKHWDESKDIKFFVLNHFFLRTNVGDKTYFLTTLTWDEE